MYTLTYADDIILIAKKEDEMRSMLDRLEMYLEKKGLELNAKNSKIMVYTTEKWGGGRKHILRIG